MAEELGIFETIYSMRAMRRLKTDPVPLEMIRKILDAGIRAPSGQNLQAWAFVVLQDPANKKFFQERYHTAMMDRFGERLMPKPDDISSGARILRSAVHLAEHMHEAPVLLLVCGKRDWPFSVPAEQRVGKAPPSYGSIYPCVQNILLACRALGLGASLTTMHQMFEDELCQRLGIPEEYGVVATIPIGFPEGKFGPVKRRPAPGVTHFERWGQHEPPQ
ncbi:MAG: nitroreductase family protein [Candidatus Binatia bacterium]